MRSVAPVSVDNEVALQQPTSGLGLSPARGEPMLRQPKKIGFEKLRARSGATPIDFERVLVFSAAIFVTRSLQGTVLRIRV